MQAKLNLNKQMSELITGALTEIRDAATENLKAQKAELEDAFQKHIQSTMETITSEMDEKVAAAESQVKKAKEETQRILSRCVAFFWRTFGSPESATRTLLTDLSRSHGLLVVLQELW